MIKMMDAKIIVDDVDYPIIEDSWVVENREQLLCQKCDGETEFYIMVENKKLCPHCAIDSLMY
jgi:hypothetical protein